MASRDSDRPDTVPVYGGVGKAASPKEGLVSVVIPTYNRSSLCKIAVESILAQSYGNLEVIVVDDGSTDDTEEVIGNMPDSRIRYVRQANAGVSAARNTGMMMAEGEFIGLLDSDDLWLPWKLEAQVQVLRAFPNAGMVWTDMVAVDETGRTLYDSYLKIMYGAYKHFDRDEHFQQKCSLRTVCRYPEAADGERSCYVGNIFPWMFMGNLVHTSTVLLRTERQRLVGGFDTELKKSGEDYNFHLRTCMAGDVAYMDISSILYRVGAADQLTAVKYGVWMARNNLTTILSIFEKTGGGIGLPDDKIRERFAEAYLWVARTELFENPGAARFHLRKSRSWGGKDMKIPLYYMLSFLPGGANRMIRDMKHRLDAVRRKTGRSG